MNARELLLFAIRVLAVWTLILATTQLGNAVGQTILFHPALQSHVASDFSSMELIIVAWTQPVVELVTAIVLWFCAPAISSIAYRAGVPEGKLVQGGAVDCEKAYEIGLRLLGVYSLLSAIVPIIRSVELLFAERGQLPFRIIPLIEGVAYLFAGLVLLFGFKRVIRLLAMIPRESESESQTEDSKPSGE